MLVIEKKFMEGSWWKYGLIFSGVHLGLWILLGYKINPDFDLGNAVLTGYAVYGAFILFAFLPFIAGRLQFRRMTWCALAGYVLGVASYFLLALYEPTRRTGLIPYISFTQFALSGLSVGVVVELGRFVYLKLVEA